MRRSSFWGLLLLCILDVNLGPLQAQNLRSLPSKSAEDMAVVNGTATIFFESYVGDLNIISTDQNPEEPIIKIGPNLWRHCIDVNKDEEFDDVSYRVYDIYSAVFASCHLVTPLLDSGQILYYKICPKLTAIQNHGKSKVDRSTSDGIATIFFDCKIDNITITQTDTLYDESVLNINDNIWFTHINVKNIIGKGGTCNRDYLLKSPYSTDYILKTNNISPNQVLYYTIAMSYELEPQMTDYHEEMAKNNKNATIFFESCAGDLNIISTEENAEEPITKIGPNLWRHCIDVNKDFEIDDISYRNYIINNSTSVECSLSTPLLNVGQKLYYKVLPKLNVYLAKGQMGGYTRKGTATIFFDSKINDLEIICIDKNHKESIVKLSDNQGYYRIDVLKEMDTGGTCNRKFLLKSPSSVDFLLTTDSISPYQYLHCTITLSNELEVKQIDYPYPDME